MFWNVLVIISFVFLFLLGFYSHFILGKFKKEIFDKVYSKFDRKGLEEMILEYEKQQNIADDMAEKEIENIKLNLSKMDIKELKNRVRYDIMSGISKANVVKSIFYALAGSSPPVTPKKTLDTIDYVKSLNLEKISNDKDFVERLKLMEDQQRKKIKIVWTLLYILLVVFIVALTIATIEDNLKEKIYLY